MAEGSESLVKRDLYAWLVAIVGGVILAASARFIPHEILRGVIFFAGLSVFADLLPVRLPKGGVITVSFAVNYAALLTYGPAVGICSAALGGFTSCLVRKTDFKKLAFNVGQVSISVWTAGLAFIGLGGEVGIPDLVGNAIPLLACALVYFLVNCTLVTGVVSLSRGEPFIAVWLMNVVWLVRSYFTLAPLGFLIAAVYYAIGAAGALLFFMPLLLARYSFQQYMNMREVYMETVRAFGAALEAKDIYTKGHSERVSRYATAIAREMKLPEPEVERIEYAGFLHDIGKIAIPDSLLSKKEELTLEEFATIKAHTSKGADILSEIQFLRGVAWIAQCHHERFDGRGYPTGLSGKAIPLGARILAVADAFDAMSSERPYRPALSKEEALWRIRAGASKQFDPKVVEAFLKVMEKEGVRPDAG